MCRAWEKQRCPILTRKGTSFLPQMYEMIEIGLNFPRIGEKKENPDRISKDGRGGNVNLFRDVRDYAFNSLT